MNLVLVPADRKLLHQPPQRHLYRLLPIKDCLNAVRGQVSPPVVKRAKPEGSNFSEVKELTRSSSSSSLPSLII